MSGTASSKELADRVQGARAEQALRAFLERDGRRLVTSRCRRVNQHGSSANGVHRCTVEDADGNQRSAEMVVHVRNGSVPTTVEPVVQHGVEFHVWEFPDDPYLPGLAAAVDRTVAEDRLRAVDGGPGRPRRLFRRYRPTRRAIVGWGGPEAESPEVYVKVLRGPGQATLVDATTELAGIHEHLLAAGVPAPPVVATDADLGLVWLATINGPTLRSLLRSGKPCPDPAHVLEVVTRIHRAPALETSEDPRRYADPTRHVRTLGNLFPDQRKRLREIGQIALDVGGPTALVHGDLHDGQCIADGDEITGVLDVDGVGMGLVAEDLGRLVANCEAVTTRGGQPAALATAYVAELTRAAQDYLPLEDIARAAAGAWISLATGPHRVQSENWVRETRTRIGRAGDWAYRAQRAAG